MNPIKVGAELPCFDPMTIRVKRALQKTDELKSKLKQAAYLGALAVSQTYDVEEMTKNLRIYRAICEKFGGQTLSHDERALIQTYETRLDRYMLASQSRVDEVLRYDKTRSLAAASKKWKDDEAAYAKGQALADQMPTT